MRPIIYEAVVIVEPIACIALLRILGINDYRSAHHMNSAYCLNLLDVNSLGIHQMACKNLKNNNNDT